jgi:transposase
MAQSRQVIPTQLTLEQFQKFVLPHLHIESRGPQPKLSSNVVFNDILKLLYLGCQWKQLPIEKNKEQQPEIPYTRINGTFRRYEAHGCFEAIFGGAVSSNSRDCLSAGTLTSVLFNTFCDTSPFVGIHDSGRQLVRLYQKWCKI